MTHATEDQIEEIFSAALDRPEQDRPAFIEKACGGDTALATRVRLLLDAHVKVGEVLPAPPEGVGNSRELVQDAAGRRVGRYTIRGTIAAGGMGVVYEAEQDEPQRVVALKMLRRSMASRRAMRRFRHEVEILGHLQHPNIAQIHDAGTFNDGDGARPYFAMEYVQGRPLIEHTNGNRLGVRDRLALFLKICDAVRYAHQHGVIHRDLKPDNILVDDQGEPKILDFGIARATDSDLQTTTLQTDIGQLIGTVPYMSPEQVAGDPNRLDTRSDVYSLGVLLYELLADRLPHDLTDRTIPEAVRIIGEEDPTPLSSISRTFRGDLDTIVAKALEKAKDRRYQSAAELAADVRHYLSDEPIVARPASTFYQLRKFARRNKALVGGVAIAFAALVLGTGFATWQAIEARMHERHARWQSYIANLAAASNAHAMGETASVRRHLEAAPEEHRGWEWRYLRNSLDQSTHVLRGHSRYARGAAFDPSGRYLATGGGDGAIRLWDVATGNLVRTMNGRQIVGGALAFSPDGSILASGGEGAVIRLWDPVTGDEVRPPLEGHRFASRWVDFSPDGRRIVSGSFHLSYYPGPLRSDLPPDPPPGGAIRIWDVRTGECVTRMAVEPNVCYVAFIDGGSKVVSLQWNGDVRFWDAESGAEVESPIGPVKSAAPTLGLNADRTLLATDPPLRLWDIASGELLVEYSGLQGNKVALSPDGSWLAMQSATEPVGTIQRIDVRSGAVLETLSGHERQYWAILIAPDGRLMATPSEDATVRLWTVGTADSPSLLRVHDQEVADLAFSPDGARIASITQSGAVAVSDVISGARLASIEMPGRAMPGIAYSPDGRCLAAMMEDESTILWDANTGERLWFQEEEAPLRDGSAYGAAIAFTPDGRRIACGSWAGEVRMRDTATGEVREVLKGDAGWDSHPILCVAISPDGARLAAGDSYDDVKLWDLRTGRPIRMIRHSEFLTKTVAFSPDGSILASVGFDGVIRLWDPYTGESCGELRGHRERARAVFSPDGRRIISGGFDQTVRLWDVATGDEVATLRIDPARVRAVAMSPDGTRLAAGLSDGTIRCFDSAPRERRIRDREAQLAAEPEARRVLETAFESTTDYRAAADRIRGDAALNNVIRRVALNMLTTQAVGERQSKLPDEHAESGPKEP